MYNRLFNSLKHRVWKFFYNLRCRGYRRRYTNSDVTIISMNCVGGVLTHNVGQRFCSPTVNLYLKAEDFIKLCENLKHYMAIDRFEEVTDPTIVEGRTYPIGKLDDINVYCVHYKTIDEASAKWNERKKRINWDKIAVICNDRDGMTPELMNRFEKLPYKKVMFVHQQEKGQSEEFVYIPGYENDNEVGIVTESKGSSGLRPVDHFDWVRFLNEV